jgi:hypothetical protein
LPADFRIVVSGGNHWTGALDELRAEVRGYTAGLHSAHVDPVSTVVSAYLEAHPDKSLTQARAVVLPYLGMPANGTGLEVRSRIDATLLHQEIKQSGGSVALAKQIVAAIDANPQGRRPWHLAATSARTFTTKAGTGMAVAQWVGSNLAAGIVGAVGSMAFNQLLLAYGVDADGSIALANIQSQLTSISQQITAIASQISNLEQTFNVQLSDSVYQDRNNHIVELTAANSDLLDKMATLTAYRTDTTIPATLLQAKQEEFNQQVQLKLLGKLVSWHTWIYGDSPQGPGLTTLHSKAVSAANPLFGQPQSDMIQKRWDYLDAQVAVTLSILVSYTNGQIAAGKATASDRNKLVQQWLVNRAMELTQLRGNTLAADTMDMSYNGRPAVSVTLPDGFNADLAKRITINNTAGQITVDTLELPSDVAVDTATQLMWSQGPARFKQLKVYGRERFGWAGTIYQFVFYPMMPGTGWGVGTSEQVGNMAGPSVTFAPRLRNAGFTADDDCAIWTSTMVDVPFTGQYFYVLRNTQGPKLLLKSYDYVKPKTDQFSNYYADVYFCRKLADGEDHVW